MFNYLFCKYAKSANKILFGSYLPLQVLNSKYLRIRERHMFLKYLGRDQYDPDLPNYIALDRLVSLPDEAFCSELASTTLEDFYLFQKTL